MLSASPKVKDGPITPSDGIVVEEKGLLSSLDNISPARQSRPSVSGHRSRPSVSRRRISLVDQMPGTPKERERVSILLQKHSRNDEITPEQLVGIVKKQAAIHQTYKRLALTVILTAIVACVAVFGVVIAGINLTKETEISGKELVNMNGDTVVTEGFKEEHDLEFLRLIVPEELSYVEFVTANYVDPDTNTVATHSFKVAGAEKLGSGDVRLYSAYGAHVFLGLDSSFITLPDGTEANLAENAAEGPQRRLLSGGGGSGGGCHHSCHTVTCTSASYTCQSSGYVRDPSRDYYNCGNYCSDSECCEQGPTTCDSTSYTCQSSGYVRNPSRDDYDCGSSCSDSECCEQDQGSITCDNPSYQCQQSGYVRDSTLDNYDCGSSCSDSECCEQAPTTCDSSSYQCQQSGYVRDSSQDMYDCGSSCSDSECCIQGPTTCDSVQYQCQQSGYVRSPALDNYDCGSSCSDSECCEQMPTTCASVDYQCSQSGWDRVPSLDGNDCGSSCSDNECCEEASATTCYSSSYQCQTSGYVRDPYRDNYDCGSSCSDSECCEQGVLTCASSHYQCQASGWAREATKNGVDCGSSCSDSECCINSDGDCYVPQVMGASSANCNEGGWVPHQTSCTFTSDDGHSSCSVGTSTCNNGQWSNSPCGSDTTCDCGRGSSGSGAYDCNVPEVAFATTGCTEGGTVSDGATCTWSNLNSNAYYCVHLGVRTCTDGNWDEVPSCGGKWDGSFSTGEELIMPTQIRRTPGDDSPKVISVTLRYQAYRHQIAGAPVHVNLRGYNSFLAGPTIYARPGDTLRILVQNDLKDYYNGNGQHPPAGNYFHAANTTNLHVHGIHTSPNTPADFVVESIYGKGKGYKNEHQYEYPISDIQPLGTQWYHPHYHGPSALQLSSGASGLLVIENPNDEGMYANFEEKHLILQHHDFSGSSWSNNNLIETTASTVSCFSGTLEDMNDLNYCCSRDLQYESERFKLQGSRKYSSLPGRHYLVNGMYQPDITITSGEIQRWRMVNSGHTRLLILRVDNTESSASCTWQHIGYDGVYRDMSKINSESSTKSMLMMSGNRLDLLVKCTGTGKVRFYASGSVGNGLAYSGTLWRANVVSGSQQSDSFPSSIPSRPWHMVSPPSSYQQSHSVAFNGRNPLFRVNGGVFDTSLTHIDHTYSLDVAQQWPISVHYMNHPFHIHVNHFYVTSGPQYQTGEWLDTASVEKGGGGGGGGSTVIRFTPKYYTGILVFHCHILPHEDHGMMELLQIAK